MVQSIFSLILLHVVLIYHYCSAVNPSANFVFKAGDKQPACRYNLAMQTKPLVSIITPSFNQAAFLEQTMRSVLEQNYPNIEYWVIDGGSDDGSVEIIQKYAHQLTGWLSEKDRGQADAVNKGFARATGAIVGWLNSDDLYFPGAIQGAVEAFEKHPQASFVFSDVESIDAKGNGFHLMHYGDYKLADLMSFYIIGQPGVFMRRDTLEQAGHLDVSYDYLLDVQLWLKMAAIAEPFYVPGQVWAAARMHENAKNAAQASEFGPEAFRLAKWICEDPRFYPLSAQNFNNIWAGAYRFDASYLVDAKKYPAALRSYKQMYRYKPSGFPKTFRKVLFAMLGAFGLDKVRGVYEKIRAARYANQSG